MKTKFTLLFSFMILFMSCPEDESFESVYSSDTLVIKELSPNTYMHISYLATKSWGNVPCNGMVFLSNKEAIIADTPTTDSVSLELIRWVEKEKDCKVKGIIPTHFHVDCLGGLAPFHNLGIPSYANNKTIEYTTKQGSQIPQKGFDGELEIPIGNEKVICEFFGEGHTKDNITVYVPSENILFGGCMIKSLKSPKGNLADANTAAWPHSVRDIKTKYPKLKTVIPGHGKPGGKELLTYTINMFQ